MIDKLIFVVNYVLNDVWMVCVCMGLLVFIMGLDNKCYFVWCEYGFFEQVIYENFYVLYCCGGIVYGVVEKLVGKCWQINLEIIEGDDVDESKDEIVWEKNIKKVFIKCFWWVFVEVDCC